MPHDELVSLGRAMKMLGVSRRTLYRWEDAGKIRPVRLESGHRRYWLYDLKRMQGLFDGATARAAQGKTG
jgi:DNA-binding transcriptional MerR regulator